MNILQYIFFVSLVIFIAAIGFVASDIYLPSLPSIASYFQAPASQVQLTMTTFLLSTAFSQVLIGALSDRYGRRLILAIAILVFMGASLGCYFAGSLSALIAFRALQGMGAACGLSIGYALIPDVCDEKLAAKTFSIVIPLVAFSPAIAPILGGYIEENLNWQSIFLVLFGYGAIVLILLISPIMPRPKKADKKVKKESSLPAVTTMLRDKRFLGYTLFMMNSNALYFAFLAATPFVLSTFGNSPTEVGYAFCFASFPYMGASLLGRRLSSKLNNLQIIAIGLGFNFLGGLCMLGFAISHYPHMISILLPIFFITIGNGLLMPFSSAGAVALYPKNAGLVTGMMATLQLCAASASTFVIGLFSNKTFFPLSGLALIVVSFTIIYYVRVFDMTKIWRIEQPQKE